MAIQLSEAQQGLKNLRLDISDVSDATFVQWCNYVVRRAYRLVRQLDAERFIKENTYSGVNSSTENLPSDFRSVTAYATGFWLLDSNGATVQALRDIGEGVNSTGYRLKKSTVEFVDINDRDVLLRYIPKLTKYTSLDNYFTVDGTETGDEIIPEEFEEFLVADLDSLYFKWSENSGAESLSDFRRSRLLSEMTTYYERDTKIIF